MKMDNLEPKKLALLRILQILEDETDKEHPYTQAQIIKRLAEKYDITVERKAVGRNLSLLKEAGFGIESTKAGSFFDDRTFEQSELRLLVDSILCSRYINKKHSEDLIEKIVALGGKNFKSHVKHIYSVGKWSKSDNIEFFYNIEIADEAIEKAKQITFHYNKFDETARLKKTFRQIVSPYQMILHNQRYYLMAYNEYWKNMAFYRMDKITDVEILDKPQTPIKSVPGYKNGIDYKDLATSRPYLYADKAEKIVVACDKALMDDVVDWFGNGVSVRKGNEGQIVVTLYASKDAMLYWALQYGKRAKVLEPEDLVQKIKQTLEDVLKSYE
ncbi:MAG TPA: WYL domain-containing protein [Clostridiales bacterium]|nr:WYL domain-containing protein [Clostridiales bacterium]